MEIIRLIFEVVGIIQISLGVVVVFGAIISWILGVYPLFLRLGFARWSRKIAIVANDDLYSTLKTDLLDTGIFREKNIYPIKADTLSKVKETTLALIHYQSFTEEQIKTILLNKKPNAGFVFYFPEFTPPSVIIPQAIMKEINSHQFTTVVNMRGRLINDIVTTLLSTSYDKR